MSPEVFKEYLVSSGVDGSLFHDALANKDTVESWVITTDAGAFWQDEMHAAAVNAYKKAGYEVRPIHDVGFIASNNGDLFTSVVSVSNLSGHTEFRFTSRELH